MKTILLSAALAGLAALPACTPRVNVEQTANVNYGQYRTYDWADTDVKTSGDKNPLLKDPIAQDDIRQAIDQQLAARGIRRVDADPSFYVSTHFYVEKDERQVLNAPVGPGPYAYPYQVGYRGRFLPVNYGSWYSPGYYQGYQGTHTEHYREGTLVVDFIDAKTNNLFWRGSLADPVNNPAQLGTEFSTAAKQILAKFPAVAQK